MDIILKTLTKKNPFAKIGHNAMGYLLQFLDVRDRFKLKLVNKVFKKLNKFSLKKLFVENKLELQGRDNMNVTYLSLKLPKNFFAPLDMKVKVVTKDQGWASANYSSSWIDLQIYKEENPENIIHSQKFVENYREKSYKKKETVFNFEKKNDVNLNEKLQESLTPEGIICIKARSEYSGWECHVKEASIELICLVSD